MANIVATDFNPLKTKRKQTNPAGITNIVKTDFNPLKRKITYNEQRNYQRIQYSQ